MHGNMMGEQREKDFEELREIRRSPWYSCMKKPIVIDNVLPNREFESLYEYFDRNSPLSIWTLNNTSLGRGDPVSWKTSFKR